MSSDVGLPIYKVALELAVYIETIVKGFEKYHKYTIGVDLRNKCKEILFLIAKANVSDERLVAIGNLRDGCEEMKMLLYLAKELKAFGSFKQFEHSSLIAVSVCKQAQGWLIATKNARVHRA